MERTFLALAGVFGFLGVALGAFGAHALRGRLSADLSAIYQTAVQYHLLHTFAIAVCAWIMDRWPSPVAQSAGWLFVAGIVVFSGSLYGLALTGVRQLGAVTPIGGLAFLGGWLCVVWAALQRP